MEEKIINSDVKSINDFATVFKRFKAEIAKVIVGQGGGSTYVHLNGGNSNTVPVFATLNHRVVASATNHAEPS
mgnify:CR=1 FL=1